MQCTENSFVIQRKKYASSENFIIVPWSTSSSLHPFFLWAIQKPTHTSFTKIRGINKKEIRS